MGILEQLEKNAKRYNSSLKKIGELLAQLAEYIDDVLPEELGHVEFTHAGITFRRWKPCSNVGCLGPSFWDEDEWGLLSTTRTPDTEFYLHGDYNCPIYVASRQVRRYAARNIFAWLEAFNEFLKQKADLTEESLTQLQKLAEVMEEE